MRQIIGHFLGYAVDITRELFGMEILVGHSEAGIPVVDISRTRRASWTDGRGFSNSAKYL